MPLLASRRNDLQVERSACTAEMAGREWAEPDAGEDSAGAFRQLGMMHMTGHTVPVDLVAAHKWFNLAAMRGDQVAVRLRREIAAEMSPSEIAAAQRAARNWQSAQ